MYRCKIFMHYWKIKLCLLMKSFFSYLLNEHELSIFLHSYIVSISCIALVYSYLCYFVLTYFTQLDGHPSVYLQVELKERHTERQDIFYSFVREGICVHSFVCSYKAAFHDLPALANLNFGAFAYTIDSTRMKSEALGLFILTARCC